jgi:formiminoglutamase
MDLSVFCKPIDTVALSHTLGAYPQSMGSLAEVYDGDVFPTWQEADLVILGVEEDRATVGARGSARAPDRIRDFFYRLASPVGELRLADIGNLQVPEDLDSLYQYLALVMGVLLRAGKTVIVLGGAQDLVYGQYQAYEALEGYVEYVAIDSRPDMLDAEVALTNHSFNSQIFMHRPNYLSQFSVLGTQAYYVTEAERKTLELMHFENLRLGELRTNLRLAEPALRLANLVSLDLSCVRQSDAPGTSQPAPAGLTAEEACTLARYAGMGYRCSSFSVTECNPDMDQMDQSVHLAALVVWHFIEGTLNRQVDEPLADRSNLTRYRAQFEAGNVLPEIVFYRSGTTDRWWMEVPSSAAMRGRPGLVALVPCTEADYRLALQNDIPDRWWRAHYRYR